jgi:hypothetical protein
MARGPRFLSLQSSAQTLHLRKSVQCFAPDYKPNVNVNPTPSGALKFFKFHRQFARKRPGCLQPKLAPLITL